jgi:hypothetical protein
MHHSLLIEKRKDYADVFEDKNTFKQMLKANTQDFQMVVSHLFNFSAIFTIFFTNSSNPSFDKDINSSRPL